MIADRSSYSWPTPNGELPVWLLLGAAALAFLLGISAELVEISFERMVTALPKFFEFLSFIIVWPDWAYLPQLMEKMLETIAIAFIASSIALLLSFPLSFLAAANTSPHPIVYMVTRNILSLLRALPEMVWALVFVSAVGLGPLPGIMALAVVTTGFMAKFFAEAYEVVEPKPIEGVSAHGAGWLQTLSFGYVPESLPDLVSSSLYLLDHNVRAATILGIVGAGGVGYDMVMAMRLFDYDRIILIVLAIYGVISLIDWASMVIRRRII